MPKESPFPHIQCAAVRVAQSALNVIMMRQSAWTKVSLARSLVDAETTLADKMRQTG